MVILIRFHATSAGKLELVTIRTDSELDGNEQFFEIIDTTLDLNYLHLGLIKLGWMKCEYEIGGILSQLSIMRSSATGLMAAVAAKRGRRRTR